MPLNIADINTSTTNCRDLYSIRVFPPGLHLSLRYTLKEISPNLKTRARIANLSENEVACNLRALAINVLDLIKEQFTDMVILTNNQPKMIDSFAYNYNRGQGVIIQFLETSNDDIFSKLAWIRTNINYSQMILSYNSKTAGDPTTCVGICYGTNAGLPGEATIFDGSLVRPYITKLTPTT